MKPATRCGCSSCNWNPRRDKEKIDILTEEVRCKE